MKTIYQDKHIKLDFDSDKHLMIAEFISVEDHLSEDVIKTFIEEYCNKIREYKPEFLLGDHQNRKYIFQTDIQNWVASAVLKACLDSFVQKYAVILPSDLIQEISTTQVGEEAKSEAGEQLKLIRFKYFNSKAEALSWLV